MHELVLTPIMRCLQGRLPHRLLVPRLLFPTGSCDAVGPRAARTHGRHQKSEVDCAIHRAGLRLAISDCVLHTGRGESLLCFLLLVL